MTLALSMTAYGRATGTVNGKKVTVEIKSVNSRYFDPTVKVSRLFSYLEEKVKNHIQKFISRGKVDVYVGIDVVDTAGCEVMIDKEYARSYINALYSLRDEFDLKDDITVTRIASNKEIFVVVKPEEDIEHIWNEVLPFIDEAISSFTQMRREEGDRLTADIHQKKEHIRELALIVKEKSAVCTLAYRDKLESRIRNILDNYNAEIDETRLLTECAIYADKIAIDEELVRLESHFKAFDDIIASKDPVGRKLDFLIQEINRESNTIGSKCSDADVAHIVVDIKSEIEKIREQVQNLE